VTLAYQWLNNGSPIRGATKSSYRLSRSDRGDEMSVRITASAKGLDPVSVTSSTVKVTGTG
jgi:hypothetical protein